MPKTWIVFKAETMNAQGWEGRMLLPSEALTDILHEQWNYSDSVPEVGDRVFEDKIDEDGEFYGREGDWVVSKVCQFSSFDTDERIVVCHCSYQPIEPQWEHIERGAPVPAEVFEPIQA